MSKFLLIFTVFVLGLTAKVMIAQSHLNLVSDGDCQFIYQEGGYGIYSITFPIKHTGIYSQETIKKVKFRLTLTDVKTKEIIYSKMYTRDITLYPEDVDYITLILNKAMTKNYDCDYCIEYEVEYMKIVEIKFF